MSSPEPGLHSGVRGHLFDTSYGIRASILGRSKKYRSPRPMLFSDPMGLVSNGEVCYDPQEWQRHSDQCPSF